MNKIKNAEYFNNLPLISKEKIKVENNISKGTSKFITATLVIFIIFLLLIAGYSMAKMIEEIIISTKAEIAEPILVIENDPSIDITAANNKGTYTFKVKNYNEQEKVTETDLKYYIEIMSNLDDSINLELYQGDDKIDLNDNRTEFIQMAKEEKQENEYKLIVTYDKNKNRNENVSDIMEKIQVKVHTEQVKA